MRMILSMMHRHQKVFDLPVLKWNSGFVNWGLLEILPNPCKNRRGRAKETLESIKVGFCGGKSQRNSS
jgi:hypothetical protein